MKKILTMLTAFAITVCQIPSVNAMTSKTNDIDISNLLINDNVITCQMDGENFIYDLDKEVMQIGDATVYLETTVEYIAEDVKASEEELLNYEKEMIKEKFVNYTNEKNSITTRSSLSPQVPSNAAYVVATTYSKSISQIIAEIDQVATTINKVTAVLSLLGGISIPNIVTYILDAYGKTKTVMEAIDLTVTGTWKYNLERTTSAYPAGNTYQICYRYAHSSLIMNVNCTFGSKTITKTQSGKGGWWVSSKPY